MNFENDDQYAAPALFVALGGSPDTLNPNGGHTEAPMDIPAHLALKLWMNDTLRSGNFSPKQFRHLCENILRWELHKLEKEGQ